MKRYYPSILPSFAVLTTILTILISGCSNGTKDIIPEKKFIRILSEVLIIEKLNVSEQTRLVLLNRAFEKHDLQAGQFSKTKEILKQDVKYWLTVYEKAADIIMETEKSATVTKEK